MSLATRCSACGTVFRVAQDQLKASEGWVRCGRCNEVFSALDGLFDLEREAPPPLPGEAGPSSLPPPPLVLGEGSGPQPTPDPAEESGLPGRSLEERQAHDVLSLPPPPALPDEPPHLHRADPPDPPPAAPLPRWLDPQTPSRPAPPPRVEVPVASLLGPQAPSRWDQPGVQRGLRWATALLALGLLLQLALAQRESLASALPALRPVLQGLCQPLGCVLGPAVREIESIVVEHSQLQRRSAGEIGPLYRLELSLRNRGTQTVALPSLDLVLHDGEGATLARRALGPEHLTRVGDLGPAPATLAPGQELALALRFDMADEARVSGYAVELFYP